MAFQFPSQERSYYRFFKVIILFISIIYVEKAVALNQNNHDSVISVPIGGNSWCFNGGKINEKGFSNWDSEKIIGKTYVYFQQPGLLKVSLHLTITETEKIKITVAGKSKTIQLIPSATNEYYAGEWKIKKKGYTLIEYQGVSKKGSSYGTLSNLIISGSAVDNNCLYVKDNRDNYFYWGRRGPSVHLNYLLPENENIEWFYNEILVPKGNDVIGSYYMANGFGEGYFGIQVNDYKERRILFSVWSPFQTDDPNSIPDEDKIKLLSKGDKVHTGEFGNEGSGGQSYLIYPWKSEVTYKFLTHVEPLGNNSTNYTAYFYSPEEMKWILVASFNRPKTNTYYKRANSFLENFEPETGYINRRGLYKNQWVCNKEGKWIEINQIKFTADQTARKKFRVDYQGGIENGNFYLKNCGFFNDSTTMNSFFTRPLTNKKPIINFKSLPSK